MYVKGNKPHNKGQSSGRTWIMSHVAHSGHACLIWPFSILRNGYGNFAIDGKQNYAHRFMCEQAHGKPPSPAHQASHSCGNRACVNPHHLSWKTAAGNQFDRRLHGTMRAGRKLGRKERDEIRALKGQMSQGQIGQMYGISFQAVSFLHRKPAP